MIYYFGFFLVFGILQIVKIFRIPNKTKNIVYIDRAMTGTNDHRSILLKNKLGGTSREVEFL